MAEKLFNEYYTKNFELPGRFTAMNGAIQYFTLKADGVEFKVAPLADDATEEEKKDHALKEQAARANYLRVLEVLRSQGAQPIITSVAGDTLSFTLEQTWVYGNHENKQVSEHYAPSFTQEDAYTGLKAEAKAKIKSLFEHIKSFKVNDEKTEVVEGDDFDVTPTVEVTAGSLNANE